MLSPAPGLSNVNEAPASVPAASSDLSRTRSRPACPGMAISPSGVCRARASASILARIQTVLARLRASFADLFEQPSGREDAKPHPLDGKRAS